MPERGSGNRPLGVRGVRDVDAVRHIDLFSGIGGFSLAAQWVWGDDHEIVCFCEMDPFCQGILKKHWPGVPIVEDVRDVESIRKYATTNVDLLTGGFPCQGFSVAGKQRGKEDERYLWPPMFEVIKAVRPRWVIGENVAGIINLALDTVLSDLEGEGYATGTFVLPACAQNAPHRRDRVWIVANTLRLRRRGRNNGNENGRIRTLQTQRPCSGKESAYVAYAEAVYAQGQSGGQEQRQPWGGSWWPTQSRLGDTLNGLPGWLVRAWGTGEWEAGIPRVATGVKDRVNKLKALGNAILPQVVVPIMQAIKEIECGTWVP